MKKLTSIVIGAILIACGVVYILGAFGVADINISLDGWWTLFIIVPCFSGLFANKEKFGNLLGLTCGILLLLAAQDVFDYEMVWKTIVPIIIIMLGIKLIVKSTSHQKVMQIPKKDKRNVWQYLVHKPLITLTKKLLLRKSELFSEVQNVILRMLKSKMEVSLTFSVPLAVRILLCLKM